ncbi:hypothetical protein LCGC14_1166560, partial [marine sediment metagenome]
IEKMYAFVAEDSGPDDEGIVAMQVGDVMIPMVGADMARVESLRPIARAISRRTRKEIKLIHFTQREDLGAVR